MAHMRATPTQKANPTPKGQLQTRKGRANPNRRANPCLPFSSTFGKYVINIKIINTKLSTPTPQGGRANPDTKGRPLSSCFPPSYFWFLHVIIIMTTESWPTQSPRQKGQPPTRMGQPQPEGPNFNPTRKGQPQTRKGTANLNPNKEGPTPTRRANPFLVFHHHILVFVCNYNYYHRKLANPKPKTEGPTRTRRGNPNRKDQRQTGKGTANLNPNKEGPTPTRRATPFFLSSTIIFWFLPVIINITTESWPTKVQDRRANPDPKGPTPTRRTNPCLLFSSTLGYCCHCMIVIMIIIITTESCQPDPPGGIANPDSKPTQVKGQPQPKRGKGLCSIITFIITILII